MVAVTLCYSCRLSVNPLSIFLVFSTSKYIQHSISVISLSWRCVLCHISRCPPSSSPERPTPTPLAVTAVFRSIQWNFLLTVL